MQRFQYLHLHIYEVSHKSYLLVFLQSEVGGLMDATVMGKKLLVGLFFWFLMIQYLFPDLFIAENLVAGHRKNEIQ